MMRSLFSGVSGLRNHQTRMDVVGNNVANINTIGFKGSRTSFQDTLSQTLQGATGSRGQKGGTNPMQVGLGMGVASIDSMMTGGSLQATGKLTDLAIQNDGFFIVSNGTEDFYTRAGNFDIDASGNYTIPGTGLRVKGWLPDTDGNINNGATPVNIALNLNQSIPGKATANIQFLNNLNAKAPIGTSVQKSITVYDNEGIGHRVSTLFVKTDKKTWLYQETGDDGSVLAPTGLGQITFTDDGKVDQIKSLAPTGLVSGTTTYSATITGMKLDSNNPSTQYGYFMAYDDQNKAHAFKVTFVNIDATHWSYSISDPLSTVSSATNTGTILYNSATNTYSGLSTFDYTPIGTTSVLTVNINYSAGSTSPVFAGPDINAFSFVPKSPIQPTTSITMQQMQLEITNPHDKFFTVFDGVALQPKVLKMSFKSQGSNTWAYTIVDASKPDTTIATGNVAYNSATSTYSMPTQFQLNPTQSIQFLSGTCTFNAPITVPPGSSADNDYGFTFSTAPTYATLTGQNKVTYLPAAGKLAVDLNLSLGSITQMGAESAQVGGGHTIDIISQDGFASGNLDKSTIAVDTNGVITGRFSNNQIRSLGQVALATFNNPGGLTRSGSTLFSKSSNSGEPLIGPSGTGGRGTIAPGNLEMSNVDLAQEFSNMIITQRGFQANSKIITTSDEMLQELANLKR